MQKSVFIDAEKGARELHKVIKLYFYILKYIEYVIFYFVFILFWKSNSPTMRQNKFINSKSLCVNKMYQILRDIFEISFKSLISRL